MLFDNRYQAGELLARRLKKLKLSPKSALVVAIPRGGAVVGEAIAQSLGLPLTCVVIKKLGAPFNPELAIGATAAAGKPVLDRWLIADLDVGADYLKKELIKKKKEARSREKFLGVTLAKERIIGKVLVVVDDGLATGQTAKAAAKVIRAFGPKKLILAVPCASPVTMELVKEDYDEIVCLEISPDLFAVGQFYRDFRPVSDKEVKSILTSGKLTN